MFIVLLRFSDNKARASEFMDGHMDWLAKGFNEGVFLLAGSIQPNAGGGILAHNASLPELEARVDNDPFVQENVVSADIIEISPARVDEKLAFLVS